MYTDFGWIGHTNNVTLYLVLITSIYHNLPQECYMSHYEGSLQTTEAVICVCPAIAGNELGKSGKSGPDFPHPQSTNMKAFSSFKAFFQ